MAYGYTSIELYTIDDSGAQVRPTQTYLPLPADPPTTLTIGEKVRLAIQVRNDSGTFQDGDVFVFNARLFARIFPSTKPPFGFGWRIDIRDIGGGVLDGFPTLVSNIATVTNVDSQKNYSLQNFVFSVGNTFMDFEFDFYVTTDLAAWIGEIVVSNESRFLNSTPQNPNVLNNNSACSYVYSGAFVELFMYEADNNLDPVPFGDPTVRDTVNNPGLDSFAIPVSTKWYDEKVGGLSNWVTSTTKEDNFLSVFRVSGGGLTNITDISHKDNPFQSTATISNFDVLDNRLIVDGSMDVHIEISSPSANLYSHVLAILIKVDDVVDSTDFLAAYQSNIALIPKLDAATAWINGEVFGTPSAWNAAANVLTIDYKLDGTKLDPNATYQIITIAIDDATNYSSSHITPQLNPSLYSISLPTSITGKIQTYNNEFVNVNDLSIANFERVRVVIEVDATGYPNFATELDQIRLKSTLLGQNTETSSYRFATGQTSGVYEIEVVDAAPIYTISAVIRGYYNTAATPLQSFHEWELVFESAGIGGVEEVVIKFEQRLKHRRDDTTRLNGFRVLDYDDFQIAVLTEKSFICTDDDRVVIEVEKNGLPNMNLIAMFIPANPTSQPRDSVEEEESYASAYLDQLSSGFLDSVDVDFAAQLDPNKAYYVLNTSTLQQGTTYYVEALCYDI